LNKRHTPKLAAVRRYRTQEVAGSSPASSIPKLAAQQRFCFQARNAVVTVVTEWSRRVFIGAADQPPLFELVDQVATSRLHLIERGAGGSVERRQRPRQQLTDAIVAHDGRVAQTLDERARDACAHRCNQVQPVR
jgi:hypothetical protein